MIRMERFIWEEIFSANKFPILENCCFLFFSRKVNVILTIADVSSVFFVFVT